MADPLLTEISAALSDIVVLLESGAEKRAADGAASDGIKAALAGVADKLVAITEQLSRPAIPAPVEVHVEPTPVTINLPPANGWNFTFDVRTDKDGLIKTIEGKARRPDK